MRYSCTRTATVGVKGVIKASQNTEKSSLTDCARKKMKQIRGLMDLQCAAENNVYFRLIFYDRTVTM